MKNKIFSGIRPSGKLHLGNYLGAIKNWIELQNQTSTERAIFAVVDYHGITTPFDPKTYHQQVMDTAIDFLAAGIDPKKSLLIRQSKVPQHTELGWIFNTITPISWLDRLPTYREQIEKSPKYKNMGLLDYPVLMAADILLYKSNLVPIGEDQQPHIDIANEIAKKFNFMFGETFQPVKPHLAEGARVMSLQDPTKKMSKTPPLRQTGLGAGQASDDDGCIFLIDPPDAIREKIKKAVTDSGKEVKFDEKNKPAISNLLIIYGLLSGREVKDIEKDYDGKSYSEFKNDLTEVVIGFLRPFQEKHSELSKDIAYIEDILSESEEKTRTIAAQTMTEVKGKMGL